MRSSQSLYKRFYCVYVNSLLFSPVRFFLPEFFPLLLTFGNWLISSLTELQRTEDRHIPKKGVKWQRPENEIRTSQMNTSTCLNKFESARWAELTQAWEQIETFQNLEGLDRSLKNKTGTLWNELFRGFCINYLKIISLWYSWLD